MVIAGILNLQIQKITPTSTGSEAYVLIARILSVHPNQNYLASVGGQVHAQLIQNPIARYVSSFSLSLNRRTVDPIKYSNTASFGV